MLKAVVGALRPVKSLDGLTGYAWHVGRRRRVLAQSYISGISQPRRTD